MISPTHCSSCDVSVTLTYGVYTFSRWAGACDYGGSNAMWLLKVNYKRSDSVLVELWLRVLSCHISHLTVLRQPYCEEAKNSPCRDHMRGSETTQREKQVWQTVPGPFLTAATFHLQPLETWVRITQPCPSWIPGSQKSWKTIKWLLLF